MHALLAFQPSSKVQTEALLNFSSTICCLHLQHMRIDKDVLDSLPSHVCNHAFTLTTDGSTPCSNRTFQSWNQGLSMLFTCLSGAAEELPYSSWEQDIAA